MNKTAIKNFAIWARNKLIADISYRAGLLGITADGIKKALPQSTGTTEFYDIGTAEPYSISGDAIKQRKHLVELIQRKEKETNYKTAYKYVLEEVAYTWFNRLIAVRFMEVNDYLPSHIRVLSSESGKMEPDLVTTPFDAELPFSAAEEQEIYQLKQENRLDEVFRILFIKQCNALNEILPALFERTSDYTELLLNLSVVDQDGVVCHLVNDIPEEDFDVERGGQVEIIGWLYQYYNTELNEQVYDGNLSKSRIDKELLPAATTIYTPDWPIRYMVENSLGRLWEEGHPSDNLKAEWKYYLEDPDQQPEVIEKLTKVCTEYAKLNPEDIKVIDPCMGSGHILVYAFEVLMHIYESCGYSQRDAAVSVLKNNIYGLDIDDRAFQMAYFAVMMKARQYNRRILSDEYTANLYSIQESNEISKDQLKYFGTELNESEKNSAISQMLKLIDTFKDAKEYGSILKVGKYDWDLLLRYIHRTSVLGQLSFDTIDLDETARKLEAIVKQAEILSQKYNVIFTNPPYLGNSRFSPKLDNYVKQNYASVKSDLSMVMFWHALDDMALPNGFVSFITTSSWLFLSSFEKMRTYIGENASISSLIDFGTELFEGKVGHNPITSWVCRKTKLENRFKSVRLVDFCYARRDEKECQYFNSGNHYVSKFSNFKKISGCPITYWMSESLVKAFSHPTIGQIAKPRQGLATGDNNRFTRLWTEVNPANIGFDSKSRKEAQESGKKWFPYNKGGEFRKWYGNNDYVVNWKNDGIEIRNFKDDKGKLRSRPQNMDVYFQPSITWSKISSGSIAFRYKPYGHIFDVAGTSIFAEERIRQYIHGFCNSVVALNIAKMLSPTLNYEVGHIASFPIIIDESRLKEVTDIVNENIRLSKEDWDSFELSWDFEGSPLLKYKVSSIQDAFQCWKHECESRFNQLKTNEERLNEIFIEIYGLINELSPQVDDKSITVRKADRERDVKGLLSYALGCIMGRYSLDVKGISYAGGEWNSNKYQSYVPDTDGIIPITDEEYLEDDIISKLCEWLKAVYGAENLEENLDYIAQSLSTGANSSREIIRSYYLNNFFAEHCSQNTVGVGGKRPYYWLFDSGKQNGFKALIYLHRYNADTIGNLRVDYLHRMQRIYESEISRMQDMIDHSTSAREVAQATKRREKLQKQLKECREYDEKLAHLALSRIELDLDDGVKKNYRKIQTANDGKFYEVLADSKNIMSKE